MTGENLFTYPNKAGFKEDTTSRDAAEKAEAHGAEALRHQVLNRITQAGPFGMTADECAAALGKSVLAIRPRVSELNKRGLIEKSEVKRRNSSGLLARVWVFR